MQSTIVTCTCHDCNQQLDTIEQPNWNNTSFTTLATCWNKSCELYGVTLSPAQFNRMSEAQFEEYRAMNRKRSARPMMIAGRVTR